MIRNDFVSNSSSCSFIVISDTNLSFVVPQSQHNSTERIYRYVVDIPNPNYGNSKFGWEFREYKDFWSKLNFCAIMLMNMKRFSDMTDNVIKKQYSNHKWIKKIVDIAQKKFSIYKKLLYDVCDKEFKLSINLLDEDRLKDEYGSCTVYIDHQSQWYEKLSNLKMFDSRDNLINFLASPDSYVSMGNDNDSIEDFFE